MSGGLAPSKSTVYVGNLPFSLTNNDLHKIFEKYGKVVKVTVVKDRDTRKSKGVAFVLFLDRDSAQRCVRALSGTELFGRTIKCSVASDNGRASEFIRRKEYKDKSRCYECGEFGHVSYKCPKNALGDREPPKKKEKRRKAKQEQQNNDEDDEEEEGEIEEESLGAAIRYEQQLKEQEERQKGSISGSASSGTLANSRKKFKKSAYFSDEEEEDG